MGLFWACCFPWLLRISCLGSSTTPSFTALFWAHKTLGMCSVWPPCACQTERSGKEGGGGGEQIWEPLEGPRQSTAIADTISTWLREETRDIAILRLSKKQSEILQIQDSVVCTNNAIEEIVCIVNRFVWGCSYHNKSAILTPDNLHRNDCLHTW